MAGFHTHKGRATPGGTERFAERQKAAPDFFTIAFPQEAMGSTESGPADALGLRISSIGLGTYLGHASDGADDSYRRAIAAALRGGINLLDTAINYRCMRSERNIGDALEELLHARELKRDEVFVSTKGGYVPYDSSPPRDHWAHLDQTVLRPGLAKEEEVVGGIHCLAPAYLRNQVETSLRNLRLETVDLYYLHNPEQQLDEADRKTFLRRMEAAFRLLEEMASRGKVGAYGVATWNGLRAGPEEPGHLSLAELVELAKRVGGPGHRFRALQMPFNLAMAEAAFAPSQEVSGERVTLLEAARKLGVAVFASASILQGRLAGGLPPELAALLPGLGSDAQRALQFARSAPGVAAALVGMGRVEHVAHNLGLRGIPRAPASVLGRLADLSRR
ncbi:MAG: aldo/keto reductase [Halobacteria archaeon]